MSPGPFGRMSSCYAAAALEQAMAREESAPELGAEKATHPSTNQLHTQLPTRRLAALNFFAAHAALNRSSTEMLSINGTAMQRTLRDLNRAAVGCPSITGSWSRPVAKNQRHFGTELDR